MTPRMIGPLSFLARPPVAISSGCLALLIALLSIGMGSARTAAQDVGTDAQREAGKKLYLKYCSQCHGEKGDGEGYAAPHLFPKPRNFTTGKFKIRTTPTGALPTHQGKARKIRVAAGLRAQDRARQFPSDAVSTLAAIRGQSASPRQ